MSENTIHEDAQNMLVGMAVNAMRAGIIDLKFLKADGSVRTARASLHPSQLPPIVESDEPKKERATNPGVVKFFDLEAQAWRSFKKENLCSVHVVTIIDKPYQDPDKMVVS